MAIERARDGYFRAQGTFEHPLVLAEFSAMTACFGLASMLFPGGRLRRLIGFLTLALAILSAWLSGSRAAFVALGLGLTVVFLLWMYHSKGRVRQSAGALRRLFFLLSLCGVVGLAMPTLLWLSQGRTSTESTSTEARMYMLRIGVPSVMANPILGLGPGSAGAVAGIKGGAGVSTLDNHLLAIAIECGIPGLILFLACLIYPAWGAITRLAHGAASSSTFLAGGVGAIGAFVVTRSILSIPYNQAFAFLIAGMMIAATARLIETEAST
jgi:O-antigen ligase